MAPSAVLSRLRRDHGRSYSSSALPHDHTSLPPLQTWAQNVNYEAPSAFVASSTVSPGFPISNLSESPTDDSAASHMTALPRFSDEWHQYRPTSSTSERPGLTTTEALSSVAARAHNFVFSVQPPKKFSASLTPNDSPMPSPNTPPVQLYGDRPNMKNVSTSSLSVVEDAASHKSASSRIGKSKLYLLNPLTLLARRRSSQNQLSKAEDGNPSLNTTNVPGLPDDYDPRIRGKIVHDFSVPKDRRFNSYNGISSTETSPSLDLRPSTQSNLRGFEQFPGFGSMAGRNPQSPAHSPLFKEHFNDSRSQPHNTGLLQSPPSSPAVNPALDPPKLPAFAKGLPLDIFGADENVEDDAKRTEKGPNVSPDNPPMGSQITPEILPVADTLQTTTPLSCSVTPPDKIPTPTLDHLRPIENLPRYMTSTSSRFSFQLSSIDSEAQERLLEERHKEHAASKLANAEDRGDAESEDGALNDSDYDDDDEDLEEKVPGVNADLDEEVEARPSPGTFDSLPLSAGLRPNSSAIALQSTPRDNEGQIDGVPDTPFSLDPGQAPSPLELYPKILEQVPRLGGLGITALRKSSSAQWTGVVQKLQIQDEYFKEDPDELYFDDGNIEGLDDLADGDSFDEDMLDDESGKIHDIPAQNARRLELAQQLNLGRLPEPGLFLRGTVEVGGDELSHPLDLSISTDINRPRNVVSGEVSQDQVDVQDEAHRSSLTEDNLAYQNALVSAANKAEAQGRFSRQMSISQYSEDLNSKSPIAESQPGLISDDSHTTRLLDMAAVEEEPSDFLFDDSMEDDPMIAEANAEVLENDEDGFYGQEFGFYARVHGKGHSEMVNGGYFGPRGVECVHRSHSAKANFQEPSLTPITERSEWSHRNSIASINTLGLPPLTQAVPSPGIAQLLDQDPSSYEDEMSLSALMKLRRGAWGGSQTSLNSTSGSQVGSSPLAHPPLRDSFGSQAACLENGSFTGNDYFPRRSYDSPAMLPEVFEEESISRSHSKTGTQPAPRKQPSDSGLQSTVPDFFLHRQGPSQTAQGLEKAGKSHSRASSGAESVSYTKDPEGSGRWLLERRRTGDDGELELVEREYVAGARI
jgi:hypothetical protein